MPSTSRPGRPDELVVSGAHVVSMDPRVGDLLDGDIHVRDGEIVAVGRRLDVSAPRLDARGMIALPGLVDTHWHLWTSLFRGRASGSPATAYFALNRDLGARCRPEDVHAGVSLSLLEALAGGVTTVHDWAHNLRSPDHADADLRAHEEVGLRGRVSYGTGQGHPPQRLADLEDLARVRREWFDGGRLPLMHLGLAGRPPGLVPDEVAATEREASRELRLPVSYHVNATREHGALAMVQRLADRDMLGPDVQLVHALHTTVAERAAIRSAGASVSLSPWSEMLIGYGLPPLRTMLEEGLLVSLSVDTTSLTAAGDLWSAVRLATALHRAEALDELSLSTRRALELVTVDAARSLGLEHLVGSLTPGKRADVVLVRAHDVGTAPVTDVTNTLALATGPATVDTVLVDGRVRVRGGVLVDLDAAEVVHAAEAALAALLER